MSAAPRARRYDAAGGVLLSSDGRVVLLERDVVREGVPLTEVRLPKGHLEPGESDLECALREVSEETGCAEIPARLEVLEDLGGGRVELILGGCPTVRDERWFLLRMDGDPERLRPEHPFRLRLARDLDEAVRLLSFESEQAAALRARAWAGALRT